MNDVLYYIGWSLSVLLIILVIIVIPVSYQYLYLYIKYILYSEKKYSMKSDTTKRNQSLIEKIRRINSITWNLSIDEEDDLTLKDLKTKMKSKTQFTNKITLIIIVLLILVLFIFFIVRNI